MIIYITSFGQVIFHIVCSPVNFLVSYKNIKSFICFMMNVQFNKWEHLGKICCK